jgi:hypothetical protein
LKNKPMKRPPDWTDEEWADFRQCQDEHDDLMEQVADREAQLETSLIASYDEYEFTWEEPDRTSWPHRPSPPAHRPRPAAPGHRSSSTTYRLPPTAPGHAGTTRNSRDPF